MVTKAWWWRGRSNFGDCLTGPILKRFCDIDVEYADLESADVVGVGSVLGLLPRGWGGTVLGAGRMHQALPVRLRDARVLALRGPLSAAGIPGDFALGDLGLLAPWLIEPVSKRFRLGVVPHWSAWDDPKEAVWGFDQYDPLYINVAHDPLHVLRLIASCEKIVTSSLHGAIVADAFGIPCRIEYARRFDREGGVFKFRDYHASIGLPFELGKTRTASRFAVEKVQHELIDVLSAYETIAKGHG